ILQRDAGTGKQPRHYRVRVPHFAGPRLVPAPDHRRYLLDECEEEVGPGGIGADGTGPSHGVGEVGDDAVAPAAHLVAEWQKPGEPATEHGALQYDAPGGDVGVRAGPGVLDDERAFGGADFE